jgi:hypothetical protein
VVAHGSASVVEVDDAAAKAPLVQQLELGMDAGGQRTLATANEDRPEEEMALVDQPLSDRLAGELGPPRSRCRIASAPSTA